MQVEACVYQGDRLKECSRPRGPMADAMVRVCFVGVMKARKTQQGFSKALIASIQGVCGGVVFARCIFACGLVPARGFTRIETVKVVVSKHGRCGVAVTARNVHFRG